MKAGITVMIRHMRWKAVSVAMDTTLILLGIIMIGNVTAQPQFQLAEVSSTNAPISKDGAIMVLVQAGPFLMGSLDGDSDEKPPRIVHLASFFIDKYEVTCELYARFVKETGRKAPLDWPKGEMPLKSAKCPVVNVSYDDAEAYAKWAGKRLPTEAEWEKAARGTNGQIYPWGNTLEGKKSATGADMKDRLFPGGSFQDDRSPYGVMDMAGNAWEWTSSWYEAYPGNADLELEYGHKYKVIRGGGSIDYYGAESTKRCADRARSVPHGFYDGLGFRCVISTADIGKKN